MHRNGVSLARHNLVLVADTPKGRGIFASREIPAGTEIEVSPVLVLDPEENEKHIRHTVLYHYTYNWPYIEPRTGKRMTTQAIILGLGSMFNHSRVNQNVGWQRDLSQQLVRYQTLRRIEAGEELCISYGSSLTFDDADSEADDDDEQDGTTGTGFLSSFGLSP